MLNDAQCNENNYVSLFNDIDYHQLSTHKYSTCQYKVTIQYSNYSVVSFPHYSSSTVVLTVIGVLVN